MFLQNYQNLNWLINQDLHLKIYEWAIERRCNHYKDQLNQIEKKEKSLEDFASSYKQMGLHELSNEDILYEEYAPGVKGIC